MIPSSSYVGIECIRRCLRTTFGGSRQCESFGEMSSKRTPKKTTTKIRPQKITSVYTQEGLTNLERAKIRIVTQLNAPTQPNLECGASILSTQKTIADSHMLVNKAFKPCRPPSPTISAKEAIDGKDAGFGRRLTCLVSRVISGSNPKLHARSEPLLSDVSYRLCNAVLPVSAAIERPHETLPSRSLRPTVQSLPHHCA